MDQYKKGGKSKELYNETHCGSCALESIACDVSLFNTEPPRRKKNLPNITAMERSGQGAV